MVWPSPGANALMASSPLSPPDSLHAEHLGSYPLLALALDHRPGRNRWVLWFTMDWTVALGPSPPKHLGGGGTPRESCGAGGTGAK